ncbi:hypothetical protein PQX77_017275 [Marasmius sp. AFHP31]|nr:hypothetical protein PQX77_017275 [Marasmius sp. AFHP31]
MFATYLTNLLVWEADTTLVEVPIGWSIAMSCVLGNRVILNVRRVGRNVEQEDPQPQSQSYTSHSMYSTKPSSRRDPTRSKSWRPKGKSRRQDVEVMEQEVESETLTDMEMAQLREMRVDSSYDHLDRNFLQL